MIRLMNSDQTEPINIGNPGEFTIRQLAELVHAQINPSLEMTNRPHSQFDPLQQQPVIDISKKHLQWEAKIHTQPT